MRFLADENFPLDSAKFIENAGYDIDAVVGQLPPISDDTILARAVADGRVLLTFDSDFGSLIYRDRLAPPPAIILFRLRAFAPLEPAMVLMSLISNEADILDKFTTIELTAMRQRPFPAIEK